MTVKATWDNIELTDAGRDLKCPTTLSDKLYSLEPYRRLGWTPEQLVDNGYARVIETSREKVINWLRENTTREQWNNRDTLFFVGVNEPFTFDWETVPYDCAKGVCVIGYGKNKDAEPIHYSDVFEQPVFINGAEYILHFNDEPPRHAWYKSSVNEFHENMNSYPAGDFGKHFTVEFVTMGPTSPVKPSLHERVKKALGNREVPIGGEDHLVGQVKVDHLKAVILDKVVKEFKIPAGGDVIQWLRNSTNKQKQPEPVFFELAKYLGFSAEFNEGEVFTEALSRLKEQAVIVGRVGKLNEVCQEYGIGHWGGSVIDSVIEHIKTKKPTTGRASPRNKYDREIIPGVYVDVYDVLGAFTTGSAAIDHAVKKLLAPGQRGVKDRVTDLEEAVSSIQREIERLGEWEGDYQ